MPEKPEPDAEPADEAGDGASDGAGAGKGALRKREETKPLLDELGYSISPWSYAMLNYGGYRYNPDDLLTRKGFDIYNRMMIDDQCKAAVRFKQSAIISRGYLLELDDETLSDEEKERRIAIFELILERMGARWQQAQMKMLRHLWQGFSVSEKVHDFCEYEGKTYIGLKELKLRPFDTIKVKTDEHGTLLELVQEVGGAKPIELPLNRIVYMVHAADMDEHYGQSELRSAYRDYFSKDMAYRFRNIFNERMAGGFMAIEPTGDKTISEGTPEYTRLTNFLKNASASTGVLLPNGCKLTVTYPSDNKAFGETIKDCNLGIARSLLIPNLLGMSEQGSAGLGAGGHSDTQFKAFLWTISADGQELEDAINEQILAELGRANFADGIAPRFRFKPFSQDEVHGIFKLWADLVAKGAVEATDSDEDRLREQLDMPVKGTPIAKKMPIDPATGLPMPGGQPGQQPGGPQGGPPKPGEQAPAKPGAPQPGAQPGQQPAGEPLEETIIGRQQLKEQRRAALTRAQKRVAFTVIDAKTRQLEREGKAELSAVLEEAVAGVMLGFDEEEELKGSSPKDAQFSQDDRARINRAIRSVLKQGWQLGEKHSRDEVARTKEGSGFRIDHNRLGEEAARYFDSRAFTVTGKLSEDTLAIIRNAISQGIKQGMTVAQVRQSVYVELARAGIFDADALQEGLDLSDAELAELQAELLADAQLTAGRLDTVIRTNTFEAFNEARYNYFTDPALGGYVEALEYSAILDDVTTDICQSLNGETHAADSSVWGAYRPPNHFNCRSVLVPLVQGDVWAESDPPKVEPQAGFGSGG